MAERATGDGNSRPEIPRVDFPTGGRELGFQGARRRQIPPSRQLSRDFRQCQRATGRQQVRRATGADRVAPHALATGIDGAQRPSRARPGTSRPPGASERRGGLVSGHTGRAVIGKWRGRKPVLAILNRPAGGWGPTAKRTISLLRAHAGRSNGVSATEILSLD